MSVQAVTWALSISGLSTSEKLVLVCLANCAGGEDISYPGQKTIAKETGMTDRGVRGIVKRLEDKGFLTRHHRQREDGSRTSDEYILHISNRNDDAIQPEPECNPTGTTVPIQPEPRSGEYKAKALSEYKNNNTYNQPEQNSGRKLSPQKILESVLSPDRAKDLIDHRKSIKRPFTARGAELMAGKLARCRDPDGAADTIIERGWQGFDPEWLNNPQQPRNKNAADRTHNKLEEFDQFAAAFMQEH